MIKTIEIQNFQSHKHSTLELHPNVNVIVGRSDSGKTAIIRALKWVIWNRPSGESFRSRWGGKTKVDLTFIDDQKVSRIKDKGENQYQLNSSVFSAFGTEVPKEITEALQMNDINLQQQFDAPFLLSASSGEAASHFNKIAHIDQIGTSQKIIQSWIREIERTKAAAEKEVENTTVQLQEFEYLSRFEADLEGLELLNKDLITLYRSVSQIEKTVNTIQQIQQEIVTESEILTLEPILLSVLKTLDQQTELEKQEQQLYDLIKKLERLETEITEADSFISLSKSVESLLSLYQQVDSLKQEKSKIDQTINKIIDNQTKLSQLQKEQEQLQLLFKKSMPDVCPLCNQPITNHAKNEIY